MSGEFRRDDAYDCDVLVVGGGLVGLVASMFLAQTGITRVGGGAACRDIEPPQVARCQRPNDGAV